MIYLKDVTSEGFVELSSRLVNLVLKFEADIFVIDV